MDTAIKTAPETKEQSAAQEANTNPQPQGGPIIHGVAHFNPLNWKDLDPDDQNYPIGS